MLDLLGEIEGELRLHQQWESSPPPARAFESKLPFSCDTMRFTQWLQWILIPRTRALAEARGRMPRSSGIRPMAEESLRDCRWSARHLIILLDRLDRTITGASVRA